MVGAKGKISLSALPSSDNGEYDFVESAGAGVQVYVMDTGIRTTHTLFGGRAVNFQGLQSTDKSPYTDEVMQDLNGHGTHVAGIVGAEQYGVAPKSTLINVKVLDRDGNGSVEKIAVAINDITEEHNDNKKKYPRGFQFRGSVINMSLAWYGYSPAINTALKNAYYAGIPVIVASGNDYNRKKDPEPCSYIWTVCVGTFYPPPRAQQNPAISPPLSPEGSIAMFGSLDPSQTQTRHLSTRHCLARLLGLWLMYQR